MAESLPYLATFLSLLVGLGILFLKRIYWHPLSTFPGPILPATTSFYQFYVLWKGKEGPWYRGLHEKYGPIVRCGPNHLTFNDPDMVPIVYHRKANKTDFHQEFSCPAAVFNQKNHVDHAATKRRFGHAFSLTRVKLLEGALDEQIRKWMSVLREQAVQNALIDWVTWARYFSFDAITAISFGEPVGFLDARSDVRGLIANMDKAFYLQKLSFYPPIARFARNNALGRRIFVSQRTDTAGLGLFMEEIHRVIRKRQYSMFHKQKPFYENSMLDQWLSARETASEVTTVADIEDQMLMDMLAGPDSIVLMTTNLTFLMAAHPRVLQQAQLEIDEAFQNQKVTSPSPSYDECLHLPFVNACVREGLRIVASSFPRRRCSPSDVPIHLAGIYVPPGTSMSTSAVEIGRHKKLYGDDADSFVPERWLQASEEDLHRWETLDVHWGFGVRKCLGRHIGSMVLYKYLVLLLRQFDLRLEDTTKINIWSYPSSELIRMYPRDV